MMEDDSSYQAIAKGGVSHVAYVEGFVCVGLRVLDHHSLSPAEKGGRRCYEWLNDSKDKNKNDKQRARKTEMQEAIRLGM